MSLLPAGILAGLWLALGGLFAARRLLGRRAPLVLRKLVAALWLGRIALLPGFGLGLLGWAAWMALLWHRTGSSSNGLGAIAGAHLGDLAIILGMAPALGMLAVALLVWRNAGDLTGEADPPAG